MHAVGIEAVPAAARASGPAEALKEEPAVIPDGVMLPRDIENVPFHFAHDLGGGGELLRRREVAHIAGMDHERRLRRGHAPDRLDQPVTCGRMRAGLDADLRIADLREAESLDLRRLRLPTEAQRPRHPTPERPKYARATPQQAFHGLTAAHRGRLPDHFAHVAALAFCRERRLCAGVGYSPRCKKKPGNKSRSAAIYTDSMGPESAFAAVALPHLDAAYNLAR